LTSAPAGFGKLNDCASAWFTSCTEMPRRPRVTLPWATSAARPWSLR
jgi:hypothetical protein